jgi:hypothetical protein
MRDLISLAETIAVRLKARRESIAISECTTGGLISAALLALPGASAYFLGGIRERQLLPVSERINLMMRELLQPSNAHNWASLWF